MTRINVTKSFLPPQDDYIQLIQSIWDSEFLTNQGPLLQLFEAQLKSKLGVEEFHFVTNGTLALQLAIRTLDLPLGEIITTPFSYVATISAILWERYTPVFVDIDPQTLCMDPAKIEDAITERTRSILPVHVFGNICDVEAIARIAEKHNLKIIYDAAHAFGVQYGNKSAFQLGDVSITSFHATKLYHTIEGGGIFTSNKELSDRIELMKRFGHQGDDHRILGINAKASEFQAAMGLANLAYIDEIISRRKAVSKHYDKQLNNLIERPTFNIEATPNYAYYPVIFANQELTKRAIERLNKINVYPRRYFYPPLNTLPYLEKTNPCPIAEDIAQRIICLPLYPDLDSRVVNKICEEVNGAHD